MTDSHTLPIFVCSLILSLALFSFLIISFASIKKNKKQHKTIEAESDSLLVARNSQRWWSLGISFYASGMGCWLLFAPPETGFIAGWIGAIAYGISNASPFWIMIWLGPAVKSALGGSRGFTVVDFIRDRYGDKLQKIVSIASLFFMLIFLSAELTSIGGTLSSLSDGFHPLAAIIPVSLVTLLYTTLGGSLASLATDRVQGVFVLFLGIIVLIVISVTFIPVLPRGSFALASQASMTGVNAAIVLWMSTTLNQFLDQGMWQRVFSAQSTNDVRLGLFFGGLFTIPTVILFAFFGIIANAARLGEIVVIDSDSVATAFFILLGHLTPFWLGLVALLGVVLVSSTIDSLQSGLMALIGSELLVNSERSVIWARIGCVIINGIATLIAAAQYSVLSLLLISNIISCSIVPMLGLIFYDRITPLAAFIGMMSGLFTITACGWISTNSFFGGLQWFSLPHGPYARTTAITFIMTPAVTTVVTLIAGNIHCWLRPDVYQSQSNKLARMMETKQGIVGCSSAEPIE